MSNKRNILVIGEIDRSGFSRIRDWLHQIAPAATVRISKGFDGTSGVHDERLEKSFVDPDVIVVCQSWSDEFSAGEVALALGRWPLALWVCCYGAWCASDGRTRSTWPISVRVPVDEAECRLNHVWQVLTQQRGEPLPLTASRDEAFAFDHCLTPPVARP
ncbi:MAG: hypothetical protein DWI21_13180 [Planctomycetota bacterium]|nr:MAG: hypothetical protein DWI21_13180 [Planctomycetota bacterium]GDY08220.1 hypothetical protein LBMAG52_17060 [Planctomycetia bacterium]